MVQTRKAVSKMHVSEGEGLLHKTGDLTVLATSSEAWAHNLYAQHSSRSAQFQHAHEKATQVLQAMKDKEKNLLAQRQTTPAPNFTAHHENSSAHYKQKLLDANATQCRECGNAEEALIAATQAALTAHTAAQTAAAFLGLAAKNYAIASQGFAAANKEYTQVVNQMCPITLSYNAAESAFATIASAAQDLKQKALIAQQHKAWEIANKTVVDTAQSQYDTAAARATAAEEPIAAKKATAAAACTSIVTQAPTKKNQRVACSSIAKTGTKLGSVGGSKWGLAISKNSRYAFTANRYGKGKIFRFDLSNMASEEIGRINANSLTGVLNPSETKLYWGGMVNYVFECDTVPGGAGCTTLKYADGTPLNLATTYGGSSGHAFFINPSDPDKLWMSPHSNSFGYFDLAAKTNHIITKDLSPLHHGWGMTMSADESKMFIGGRGGLVEWTFATKTKRIMRTDWTLDVHLWPDVNGKKVLWSGLFSGHGNIPKLVCYENCGKVGETVETLHDMGPNDNYACWTPEGDKFYNLKNDGDLYVYDGVDCKAQN